MPVKNYPALAAAVVQTVIALIVGLHLGFTISPTIGGAIEAFAAAAVAVGVAVYVDRPTVAVFVGLVNAGITLLVAFRVPHITASSVSLIDAVITAALALFVHSSVSSKSLLTQRAQRAASSVSRRLAEPRNT